MVDLLPGIQDFVKLYNLTALLESFDLLFLATFSDEEEYIPSNAPP